MRTMKAAFPTFIKTRATANPVTPRGQQIHRSDSLSGHAQANQQGNQREDPWPNDPA